MIMNILKKIRIYYLKNTKWKRYKIGKKFHAGRNVIMWAKNNIIIGDNCYVGRNSQIESNLKMGNYVLIANNVAFVGKYDHNYLEIGKTIIKNNPINASILSSYFIFSNSHQNIISLDVY